MGDVAELINTCRSRGIELFVRGGRLGARPKSLVDEELEWNISKHKPELLALLSKEAQVDKGNLTPSLSRAVTMTQEVFSRSPKPQPNDGLNPDAREALGVIHRLSSRERIPDALAVADAMQVTVTAISGALVELEGKRLIHSGDWTRCGTKIKLVTH